MVSFGKGCSGGVEERRGGDQLHRRDEIIATATVAAIVAAGIHRMGIGIGHDIFHYAVSDSARW